MTQVHEAVMTPPAIRMNDAFDAHAPPNDALKGGFRAIGAIFV
jgi:hypothetical protein